MPVLLLSGAQSQEVMPVINAGLARRLSDARCKIIAGAGHMVPITHPEETAAQLRAFWSQGPDPREAPERP